MKTIDDKCYFTQYVQINKRKKNVKKKTRSMVLNVDQTVNEKETDKLP